MKTCPSCAKKHGVNNFICRKCARKLSGDDDYSGKIIGFTIVRVPSIGHEDVPYAVLLVRRKDGSLFFRKTKKEPALGEAYSEGKRTFGIRKVVVIGSGVMGSGIASLLLRKGFVVGLKTRASSKFSSIRSEVESFLVKSSGTDAQALCKNLRLFSEFNEIIKFKPDLIIESVIESLDAKKDVLSKLGGKCLIVSNTSSIPIKILSKFVPNPSLFAGFHFFNPVDRMQLVEIIPSREMKLKERRILQSFCKDIGKTPVVVGDEAGFVVNRIMAPLLNEAALVYEKGIAEPSEIDKAVQLGLNHPMGPLRLLDLIGLDVFAEIMNSIHEETGEERFRPAKIILEKISEGKLGKKAKEGFYKYP